MRGITRRHVIAGILIVTVVRYVADDLFLFIVNDLQLEPRRFYRRIAADIALHQSTATYSGQRQPTAGFITLRQLSGGLQLNSISANNDLQTPHTRIYSDLHQPIEDDNGRSLYAPAAANGSLQQPIAIYSTLQPPTETIAVGEHRMANLIPLFRSFNPLFRNLSMTKQEELQSNSSIHQVDDVDLTIVDVLSNIKNKNPDNTTDVDDEKRPNDEKRSKSKSDVTMVLDPNKRYSRKTDVAELDPRRRYMSAMCFDSRRLGNLMFNFAALVGIAAKNGMVPVMPYRSWNWSLPLVFQIEVMLIAMRVLVNMIEIKIKHLYRNYCYDGRK